MNFVQLLQSGKVNESEIDNYIDEWHNGDSDLPLHEYLGMTQQLFMNCVLAGDASMYNILEKIDLIKDK